MLLLSAQKPACSSAGVSAQVPWTCMGRDKTFPSSPNLPVMDVIADVNTASLGEYLHSSKTGQDGRKGSTMNSTAKCSA